MGQACLSLLIIVIIIITIDIIIILTDFAVLIGMKHVD